MTDLATIQTRAVAGPSRVGQATAVEQSRAVAEVQAAVIVAQQVPRSITEAQRQMREACTQMAMAERAFFRFRRAGSQINGETVHLARELARCWGNVQYGLTELRRDDEARQSEMQAWAWDVQTNSRASTTFIVPHARDKDGGVVPLDGLRDIYENNANLGSRRLREQIFAILPAWFVEQAKDVCHATIAKGTGDKPHAQRVADAVALFGTSHSVGQAQLEDKLGRKADDWTPGDLATLLVIHTSLTRGEVTRNEEFPPASAPVTADEVIAKGRRPKPAPEPDADDAMADPFPEATA